MTTSQTTISWGIRLVLGLFIGSCLTGNVLTPTTLAQDPALDVVDLHYDRFTGLEQAISIVVSPDSADLYTASPADHAVGVFHRDATTGEVAFIAAYKDGEADVTGLQGVNSLAMAPLGTHVYATSGLDNAVAVFSRNASTGTLTFVEMVADGENGVDGLSGVQAAVISPDGAHLYTVSQGEHALAVFTRNGDTGALTFVEAHYDAIDSVDGLYYANAVAVSPDGAYVYATGCYDHALAVFSRAPETGRLNFAQVLKNGDNGVDGLNFARSVTVSADGHNVYAIGLNAIAVFERDPDTGELIFVEAQKDGVNDVNGLSGANTVTISPNGFSVYVTGAVDDAVAIFERDSATGALTFLAMQHDGTGDVTGLDGARSVAVSPDNSQVYVVSNRDHGLTVFDRDAATGTLSHAATLDDGVGSPNPVMGLDGAKSLAFSPDTRQVYVAGSNNTQDDSRQDAVAVFSRNIATGALTFIDAYADGANGGDALNGVNAVVVSPDGRHVYAMGAYDDAVTIFSRHDSTGALTFIGTVTEGEAGVSGLDWPVFLAISPDGAHLYVKGPNTIVAFERNPATGTLLFVEKKVKGEDGVSGIYGYSSQVMVSPDGAHVFVAGDNDNAFAVFGRDTATGALSFIEYHQDGAGEIDGLAGVRSVIVSPDGAHVYAAGYSDQAIALFGRDSGTGQLTFLEAR